MKQSLGFLFWRVAGFGERLNIVEGGGSFATPRDDAVRRGPETDIKRSRTLSNVVHEGWQNAHDHNSTHDGRDDQKPLQYEVEHVIETLKTLFEIQMFVASPECIELLRLKRGVGHVCKKKERKEEKQK